MSKETFVRPISYNKKLVPNLPPRMGNFEFWGFQKDPINDQWKEITERITNYIIKNVVKSKYEMPEYKIPVGTKLYFAYSTFDSEPNMEISSFGVKVTENIFSLDVDTCIWHQQYDKNERRPSKLFEYVVITPIPVRVLNVIDRYLPNFVISNIHPMIIHRGEVFNITTKHQLEVGILVELNVSVSNSSYLKLVKSYSIDEKLLRRNDENIRWSPTKALYAPRSFGKPVTIKKRMSEKILVETVPVKNKTVRKDTPSKINRVSKKNIEA
jgi:hypothetical protein